MLSYVIVSILNPTEYWSNRNGWVDLAHADRFSPTQVENQIVNLPYGGKWICYWDINELQFARFIAECESCGVFDPKNERMIQVKEEMDLGDNEICKLIERAEEFWNKWLKNGFEDRNT